MDIEYIMGAIAIDVFIVICLAYNHYTFNFIEKAGIGIVKPRLNESRGLPASGCDAPDPRRPRVKL